MQQIPEDANIDCHLQRVVMGGLECLAAQNSKSSSNNKVSPEVCYKCEVGKIHREIACNNPTARIFFYEYSGNYVHSKLENIFCPLKKRNTTLDLCKKCELVLAPETKIKFQTALNLFQDEKFFSAFKDFEKAKNCLRDGKYESVIGHSSATLESVMKICHEKMGEELPNEKGIHSLWKSTRKLLQIDDLDSKKSTAQLVNSLTGLFMHYGSYRNELSDDHGRGLYTDEVNHLMAELALNTTSTLSIFIIKSYHLVERKTHE